MVNFTFGNFFGDRLNRLGIGETNRHDQIRMIARQIAQQLFFLRIGRNLRIVVIDMEVFFEALGTVICRFIKALVKFTSLVVNHGRSKALSKGGSSQQSSGNGQAYTFQFDLHLYQLVSLVV